MRRNEWVWLAFWMLTSTGGSIGCEGAGDSPGPRFEQETAAFDYTAPWTSTWYTRTGDQLSGGSQVAIAAAGARATFEFTGTALEWIGSRDSQSGIANVYIDGTLMAEVDTYAEADEYQVALYSVGDLSPGGHTLAIEPTGTRHPASDGSWIAVDAVAAEGIGRAAEETSALTMRIEQGSSSIAYSAPWTPTWHANANPSHSGGSMLMHMDAGSRATLTFQGTGVTWLGFKDPWSGIARVYLDGLAVASIDTYASPQQFQARLYQVSNLAPGAHTLTIEATGTRRAGSGGSWVSVDAFEVEAANPNPVTCSLTASARTVQVGQGYSLAMSISVPAARAEYRGSRNGTADAPSPVPGWAAGATSLTDAYVAQPGQEAAYTRTVVFLDAAGTTLCTTSTVAIDILPSGGGPTGATCSLALSASSVQVGQTYSAALSISVPAARATFHGTRDGVAEPPVAIAGWPAGGTTLSELYQAMAGQEAAYTRAVVFQDAAGATLCTTPTAAITIFAAPPPPTPPIPPPAPMPPPTPAPTPTPQPPPPGPGAIVDPTLLPVATTGHGPLTSAYDALGVPALAAGGSYTDPTTGVRVTRLTSATFPEAGFNWGHAYSEGGDEVSLPYIGQTRAIHLFTSGGRHALIDFTPGVGVSNYRPLTGGLAPWGDLGITFSNNPATPQFVYISTNAGSTIRRFDLRTLAEVPGDGWPVTGETEATWLHQSEGDGLFTWMRGANGSTVVGYQPGTGIKKTYTNGALNEPRIDRAGRYIGLAMNTPQNALLVWDWEANAIAWTTNGSIPFAHNASLRRRWMIVNWNISFPGQFTRFIPDVPNSAQNIGGPANSSLAYGNGNWIQHPADLDDQWALYHHYGSLVPGGPYAWLAPGAMIFVTANGERRILGHPYNTSSNYAAYAFAKSSPDGRYVLFTSNMNGSSRYDLFLAEVPAR